jgi:hypothetical protein
MRTIRTHRTRLLPLTLALAALAATALTGAAPVRARQAAAPAQATSGIRPLTLPGLRAPSYMVTLLTGDQVTLTAAGGKGRYQVTATPASAAGPPVEITAHGGPAGTTGVSALPAAAGALITSGALDRNLFDVTWLAAHGDSGPAGHIPVTIYYPGRQTAATLAGNADKLPGAHLAASHPASGTVDLTVAASHARRFWAALTGQPGSGPASPGGTPHLAGGAGQAWPTGSRTAPAAEQPADQPLYQVTETITRPTGAFTCNAGQTTLCVDADQHLYGVAGPGADDAYFATSISCVNSSPCTTYHVTYSVPIGVYSALGTGFFFANQQEQDIALDDPQLTVAGDTSFTLDAGAAQQITISTPRPAQAYDAAFSDYRMSPDGTWTTDISDGQTTSWWAIPSSRVTVGTFHIATGWVLGKPLLAMTVTAPQRLTLDAQYPTGYIEYPASQAGSVRFPGRQTLTVVNAGDGSTSAFADIDAHGKLALIDSPSSCVVFSGSLLDNALAAGAAGVLLGTNGACALPAIPPWYSDGGPVPNIPVAEIPADQASTLTGLLAHSTVQVNISSYSGNTPYLYSVNLYQEGRIPASLHTTLTNSSLEPLTNHYHASQADVAGEFDPQGDPEMWYSFRPDDYFVTGTTFHLALPAEIKEYRGPLSPSAVDERFVGITAAAQAIYDVNNGTGNGDEYWNTEPMAPGTGPTQPDVFQAQPGKWSNVQNHLGFCAFCRQGNTFLPVMYLTSGADPYATGPPYVFDPSSIHLYQNGQEIPPTPVDGVTSFQLPAQQATYELTAQFTNGTATSATTWRFTSAAPASDRIPPGDQCLGTYLGSAGPCAPAPLVLLSYDAHTTSANAIPAAGPHQLDITAYHQDPNAPLVTSLKLWTSTDGGKTWQQAHVHSGRGGTFTATYTVPASGTSGYVSIKAQASDAVGNDISQEIDNAYAIAGTSGPAAPHGR